MRTTIAIFVIITTTFTAPVILHADDTVVSYTVNGVTYTSRVPNCFEYPLHYDLDKVNALRYHGNVSSEVLDKIFEQVQRQISWDRYCNKN